MTTPHPYQHQVSGPWTLGRVLLVISCVLFVIAAFAFGGDPLGDIAPWSWMAGGFSAWVLSGAVP
jgi:hypothetical protein